MAAGRISTDFRNPFSVSSKSTRWMTAEQFRQLAIKLFGPERGWQSRCAEELGTDRASVSRWLASAITVPGPVAAAMSCWELRFEETGRRPGDVTRREAR